jgi:hypothetical protein
VIKGGIFSIEKNYGAFNNFNDVLFSVGTTWTFNKYNNFEK